MGFKRKRSVDESPVSVSSFSSCATPEAQSPTPTPNGFNNTMEIDAPMSRGTGWDFSNLGRVKSGDWGMRTRKRHRDNRPDERVIHGTHSHILPKTVGTQADKDRNHHQQALLCTTQAARRAHPVWHPSIATSPRCTEASKVNVAYLLEYLCAACTGPDGADAT